MAKPLFLRDHKGIEMTRRFNPLSFLRNAPNYLLREYFKRRGVLTDFQWDGRGERDSEGILDAITRLDDDAQDLIMREFSDIHARTRDGGFVKAILDEARFHSIDPDLPERFDGMRNHLERAFWIFLNRHDDYWDGSNVIWRVDKITAADQWTSRPDMPSRPGPVDEGVVEELRLALIDYFSKREARGRRCKVEAYRRDDEEIFYAYPEDYKQTVSEYVGDNLEPRLLQPAFEIIFRHVDVERKLDVHVEGDTASPGMLQVLFARAVLKEEIDESWEGVRATFHLQELMTRAFDFSWPSDTGIDDVLIKFIRFKVEDDRWQRVTLEVNPTGRPKAIYDLLDRTTRELEPSTLLVDQVGLSVLFRKGPSDRRTPTRGVVITAPHTCRMTYDSRGEQIYRMLESSGIATRASPRQIEG